MPNWVLLTTTTTPAIASGVVNPDTFARANGSAIGNGWDSTDSSVFSIVSEKANYAHSNGLNNGLNFAKRLTRPDTEYSITQKVSVEITPVSAAIYPTVYLRSNKDTLTGYAFSWGATADGTLYINKITNATTNVAVQNINGISAAVNGNTYRLEFAVFGSSPTTIYYKIVNVTTSTTLVDSSIVDSSNIGPQTAGAIALGAFSLNGETGNIKFDNFASYLDGVTLSANPTTINVGSTTAVTVTGLGSSWTPGTPGTPVFTLSGGTGASIVSQTINSSTSATLQIDAGSAAGSLTALEPASGATVNLTAVAVGGIFVGIVGDSNLVGYGGVTSPIPTFQSELQVFQGNRVVTVANSAVSGSKVSDWQPGGTNYNNLITALNNAGAVNAVIVICLGTNDAGAGVSKASHKSGLQTLCDALIALGHKVLLCYPSYCNAPSGPYTAALADPFLIQYQQAVNELVDGENVLQGDVEFYSYIKDRLSELQPDGVHLVQVASNTWGKFLAHSYWRAVYSTQPSGGGGTFPTTVEIAAAVKSAILSDGTPFAGANINAAIASRPTLAEIEASNVLAKQATLNLKASQASVNAIPNAVAGQANISAALSHINDLVEFNGFKAGESVAAGETQHLTSTGKRLLVSINSTTGETTISRSDP